MTVLPRLQGVVVQDAILDLAGQVREGLPAQRFTRHGDALPGERLVPSAVQGPLAS